MSTSGLRPAASYVRVSSGPQDKGYSPEIQEEAIKDYAKSNGFYIALEGRDAKSGHVTTREDYLMVLDAAKHHRVDAVIVYMWDRFGRDQAEWLKSAKLLKKWGVEFHSVREGGRLSDDPVVRGVFSGLAEKYSEQLAQRVRPALLKSVERGQHIGITPWGYKRVRPEHEAKGRYVPSDLVPVEPAASYVREMFTRYAAGGWPLRALAGWMNSDPACPPSPKGAKWTICNVRYILMNPVYTGRIRYQRSHKGKHETSPEGSEKVHRGNHPALIEVELFDRVQRRIDAARTHEKRSRIPRALPIGAGLLKCAGCGGPMTIARRRDDIAKRAQYICRNKREGIGTCDASGYVVDVAHEGMLAQVSRLRGTPWQEEALDRVHALRVGHNERAELVRALAEANARMDRHVKRLEEWDEEPAPQEKAAHRKRGRELSDDIVACEAAIAALPAETATVLDLKTMHEQFMRTSIADQVAALVAANNDAMLREVLLALVESAKVVERVPEQRSTWARVDITWSKEVQMLIQADLLRLGPDVERPYYPATVQEQRRARYLRYAARKKAGLVGQ